MFLYINATRCAPTSDYSDRLLERVLVFAERSPELVPNKIADGVLCLVPSGQQRRISRHAHGTIPAYVQTFPALSTLDFSVSA